MGPHGVQVRILEVRGLVGESTCLGHVVREGRGKSVGVVANVEEDKGD